MTHKDHNAYMREVWYPANKARHYATVKKRIRVLLERVRLLKLEHGCKDCGYTAHASALDFDHIGDCKTANISRLIKNGYCWEKILVEIKRCEVVCANCHRVRTFDRLLSGSTNSGAAAS